MFHQSVLPMSLLNLCKEAVMAGYTRITNTVCYQSPLSKLRVACTKKHTCDGKCAKKLILSKRNLSVNKFFMYPYYINYFYIAKLFYKKRNLPKWACIRGLEGLSENFSSSRNSFYKSFRVERKYYHEEPLNCTKI